MSQLSLSIAVIHHHLRGYPEDCLESLGAGAPRPDTEFLIVAGREALGRISIRFQRVRIVPAEGGDRATAKNLAVAESRGKFILLATSDTVSRPDTVRQLCGFLQSHPEPSVVSAQLLSENGRRRRTAYTFPSLLREINPFGWAWRRRHLAVGKRRPVQRDTPVPAAALHATFLMTRREVFDKVGEFSEGYRFGYEDVEWCFRAAKKGIGRYVLPCAQVFKLSPQLRGELPVEIRLAMEQSLYRLEEATRGRSYAAACRGLRRFKSFWKWTLSGALVQLLCGGSALLTNEQAVHGAIWRMRRNGPRRPEMPLDAESHVRWENAV